MSFIDDVIMMAADVVAGKKKESGSRNGKLPRWADLEIGTTGTKIFAGLIDEEYLTEWQNLQSRCDLITRMLRSDATIQAVNLAIELPIMGATWDVEVPKDSGTRSDDRDVMRRTAAPAPAADEKEIKGRDRSDTIPGFERETSPGRFRPAPVNRKRMEEIASFIHESFFEGTMDHSWDYFIRHALMSVFYGFMPFEKVMKWSGDRKRIVYRKFAERMPWTIWRWKREKNGEFGGLWQMAYFESETTNAGEYTSTSDYREVFIPAEKLLLFSYRRMGSNFEGQSILRGAYRHWYYKDKLYQIQGIGIERNAAGSPVVYLPEGFNAKALSMAKKIVKSWRIHAEAGGVIPPGFDLAIVDGRLNSGAIDSAIIHHDTQIAKSVLAAFLNLPGSPRGSYALSRDHSDFFMMSLKSVVEFLCHVINKYAVRPLVDLNFGPQERYPVVTCNLPSMDMAGLAQVLSGLVSGGLVKPDTDLEDHIRERLNLPPRSMEQRQMDEAQRKAEMAQMVQSIQSPSVEDQAATAREQVLSQNPQGLGWEGWSGWQDVPDSAMRRKARGGRHLSDDVDMTVRLEDIRLTPGNELARAELPHGGEMIQAVEPFFDRWAPVIIARSIVKVMEKRGLKLDDDTDVRRLAMRIANRLRRRFMRLVAIYIARLRVEKEKAEAVMAVEELDSTVQLYNPWHDKETGRFTTGPGGPILTALRREERKQWRNSVRRTTRRIVKDGIKDFIKGALGLPASEVDDQWKRNTVLGWPGRMLVYRNRSGDFELTEPFRGLTNTIAGVIAETLAHTSGLFMDRIIDWKIRKIETNLQKMGVDLTGRMTHQDIEDAIERYVPKSRREEVKTRIRRELEMGIFEAETGIKIRKKASRYRPTGRPPGRPKGAVDRWPRKPRSDRGKPRGPRKPPEGS